MLRKHKNLTNVKNGVKSMHTYIHFNKVIFEPSNSVTLTSQLNIEGDLSIESGSLEVNDNIIAVGGNWTNLVGDSGFEEGTGLD